MPGIVIDGRFEVERTLGKSESHQRFVARDAETGQTVFIKIIRPESADANENLTRQMQEYQLLRKLDHPNAVKVIKSGLTQDNCFYVATEFVEGERLSQLVGQQGSISPEQMSGFLDQLADVLDLAHSYGIVHRDLSLRNMLIQEQPNGEMVCRLIGFASAKVLANTSANVTQAGVTLGSPDYMSPEQALGRKLTKLSDVYSMGVVLFTALTGRLPFQGKNDMMTLVAHVKQPVPTFREVNPSVSIPGTVEAVVRQALAKEPAYRPKSVGELARMFREAVNNPSQLPEGLAELQEASTRSTIPVAPTENAAPVSKQRSSPITVVVVIAAVAIGALLGYVMSQ